jgi:hypothetical protein
MNTSNWQGDQNEIPDWANPELVYAKARRLESIPFVLIPAETPFTSKSLARIRDLEQSIRDADARNQPFRLSLTSTVLKTPLKGGWPAPAEKQEDSDIEIEYILAETEEVTESLQNVNPSLIHAFRNGSNGSVRLMTSVPGSGQTKQHSRLHRLISLMTLLSRANLVHLKVPASAIPKGRPTVLLLSTFLGT